MTSNVAKPISQLAQELYSRLKSEVRPFVTQPLNILENYRNEPTVEELESLAASMRMLSTNALKLASYVDNAIVKKSTRRATK